MVMLKFGVGLAVGGEKSAANCQGGLLQAAGENAGGDLAVLTARSQARRTARARSSGVSAAVSFAKRSTLR